MSQQFIIKLNEQGPQGAQGERGETGATGNGINFIDKTSTSGIVDTYTIYYTNGNTSTFEVTNGNSIDTIEKTSTVGIVDTYTITMVDGSTHTFTVTNGTSISSIEKTSTVGLTDTYTITLTNGDISTFTVTNGNGIASINKTATSGLTDTYTITFTNGSTMDFNIKNGKSIVSVTGPTTVGLVDTYTINFNDNTSSTFNVTNGNGITNIEKTGSTGLIDTYTINMSNGSYETFTVTNGEKGDKGDTGVGVVGITKTSTSGLEDTYTMSYSDGSSSTFVVTNGNGIEDIELLSTVGLTNNYRINFDNGTYFDYSLNNAKSIVSIAKTFTSGLVDTYTITFNDNTTFQFPVTNGRGVTSVSLLSWEGLEKTYRMTFNDGSYFDFVVTNGTGQVDWGGLSGVLSQQSDLQDALVQSNGLTTGSVSTYNVMLGELIERAHSTFDSSKFTVVGSPNITDDGIFNAPNLSNYLTISPTFDLSNFEWSCSVIINSFPTSNVDSFITQFVNSSSVYRNGFRFTATNHFSFALLLKDGTNLPATLSSSTIQQTGKYNLKLSFDGAKYVFKVAYPNGTVETVEYSSTSLLEVSNTAPIYIGRGRDTSGLSALNLKDIDIDLKDYSIVSGGVSIFNGNKEGIDTIKPDDYLVVGTPTISADGIASGFSSSNYITTPAIDFSKPFEIVVPFKLNAIVIHKCIFQIVGASGWWNYCYCSSRVLTFGYQLSDSTAGYMSLNLSQEYILNKTYYANLVFNGATYILRLLDENKNVIKENSYETSLSLYNSSNKQLNIGYATNGSGYDFSNGTIDLNSVKIYVDGNLVYQPCLKIPYTESKTGSKIVNSIYRDRVNDMSSQFGYANYYTLDEDNGNFTLPQVELYGLIGDKTLRDSYYNGATYWELYSNRRLEQGGSCESGVEYTLPKPFADANYILTIPYSSKTATSFIPSATGDFIAKGTGLL